MTAPADCWGEAIRLDAALRTGKFGIAAVALRPPFGVWVATGRRQHKHLYIAPGANKLFYLYQSLLNSPEEWWGEDFNQWAYEHDKDDTSDEAEDEFRAIVLRDSEIRGAIVGVALLGTWEREDGIWEFAGGRLLPEPIPRERFAGRPGQGIFYPFGREAA